MRTMSNWGRWPYCTTCSMEDAISDEGALRSEEEEGCSQ